MLPGDILIFKKGKGIIPRVLSWLLHKLEPNYEGWGWHMAMIVMSRNPIKPEYFIVEAVDKGVMISQLKEDSEYRIYRWFTDTPTDRDVWLAVNPMLGKPYDWDAYLGTVLAYIWYKLTGKSWAVIDDEFQCWELTFWLCRLLGEWIQPISKYPLISDFLKHYKNPSPDGIYRRVR